MNSKRVDVSVIVPCFRCVDSLDRAIKSVLAQTELPKELILVDDASGDGTLMALYSWRDRFPDFIRVLALSVNQGAGVARNAGWSLAEGDYVAFLDSDDSWHPKKLAIQYAFMKSHPGVALSGHGHVIGLALTGDLTMDSLSVDNLRWWRLLVKNPFVTPSAMVRRDVVPRFLINRRYMEDHLLWMELALSGGQVVRLNLPLAILHKAQVGVAGLSSHVFAMSRADLGNYWQLYRRGLLGLPLLLLCWGWGSIKFFRRVVILGISSAWQKRKAWRD
jgi:glycosyltransferase involved in cell wall biosynthesis